eukprot:scaffold50652_cov36-Attheya_sp.AAC.2
MGKIVHHKTITNEKECDLTLSERLMLLRCVHRRKTDSEDKRDKRHTIVIPVAGRSPTTTKRVHNQ